MTNIAISTACAPNCNPQLPPATDEDEYPRFFWPINPTPAFGARRGWQHTDLYIHSSGQLYAVRRDSSPIGILSAGKALIGGMKNLLDPVEAKAPAAFSVIERR